MKREFQYMLRYGMVPGLHEEQRLENLLTFCRQTKTNDVMFFYNCEELNRGHYTPEELELWLDLIARMKPVLAKEGITTSINPWTTMLHTDRGRTLRPGQDFILMVDPEGNEATAVACPACDNFLKYLAWQYRMCAEKVHPNVLWVEDDFRLHNHEPLVWGGCFCEKHMAMFSERAGRKLTREEFVAGLLAPGDVHPFRRIWLDVALETMLRMAETIRQAVMEVSPETRIGLMTSDPATHCAEGRDWEAVFSRFKTTKEPYIRIHLPSYVEATSQDYGLGFHSVSRLVRHLVPDRVENYGELENYPFSRYSTSVSFSQMEVETNALLDGKGITMDIHDMMGNGVLLCEGYQDGLAQSRPFLNTLVNLGLDNRRQAGVRVMVDPTASSTLKTRRGKSMTELYPSERNIIRLLAPFGLATCYESCHSPKGKVVAVAGQFLRNLTEDEAKALFENNYVILDGEAAKTLLDLKWGALAGMAEAETIPSGNGVNGYEQVVNGKDYCGLSSARLTMQVTTGDFVKIRYLPDAQVTAYTHAFSPFDVDNGPAMVTVNNRVLVIPYERYGGSILYPIRKEIMLDALRQAWGVALPIWADAPHTTVIHYELEDRTLVALVNFSGDSYPQVSLTFPQGIPAYSQATLYSRCCPEGVPARLTACCNTLTINHELPRIQMMVLEFKA